jgi:FkbM family methyltransferase
MPDPLPIGARARQWAFFASWRLRQRLVRLVVPRRHVSVRGMAFSLPCENWITDFRQRTYASKEPETLDWIDGLSDRDVLIDVGANIGLYALYAARRHPAMRVVALEPEYSNLHLFRDNVIENRVEGQITIYPVALGATDGLSYLHIQDLHPGAALHSVSNGALSATRTARPVVAREGIVEMLLDTLCARAGIVPTCMKIDVDGNEQRVLAGAARTLASPTFRSLLIEMPEAHHEHAVCVALLEKAGLTRDSRGHEGTNHNEIWSRK